MGKRIKKLRYQDFEAVISEGEFAIFHKGNYIMNQIISDEQYESLLIFMSDDFMKRVCCRQRIKAVPYVMECIELLFVSYFESVDDLRCAGSAYKIFTFIQKQEDRIWKSGR